VATPLPQFGTGNGDDDEQGPIPILRPAGRKIHVVGKPDEIACPKPMSTPLQTAVDADTGLILHHEVTTEPTDNRLLYPMAAAAKDALAVDALTVVADLATQMGTTQPPASVKGLRHASRQTVRLTIKATGHSSTDPPSSISRTVTPTHVRWAAGWYANRSCGETIALFTPLRTAVGVL
jgi:hypothetical protein